MKIQFKNLNIFASDITNKISEEFATKLQKILFKKGLQDVCKNIRIFMTSKNEVIIAGLNCIISNLFFKNITTAPVMFFKKMDIGFPMFLETISIHPDDISQCIIKGVNILKTVLK